MSEDLHGIDKLFQESLEGQAEAPPPHVWEQLDKKLDQQKAATIAGRYNKLKWVAAALFLISIGMAMWVVRLHTRQPDSSVVRKDRNERHAGGLPSEQKETLNSTNGFLTDKDNPLQGQSGHNDSIQTRQLLAPASVPGHEDDEPAKELAITETPGAAKSPQANKVDRLTRREEYTSAFTVRRKRTPAVETIQSNQINKGRNKKGATAMGAGEVAQKKGSGEAAGQILNKSSVHPIVEVVPRAAVIADPTTLANSAGIDPSSLPKPVMRSSFLELANSAPQPIRLTPVHAPAFTGTVFFSPNLVSNSVTNDSRIPHGREDDKNVIKAKEQNGFSWSAGALLGYNFKAHWSVSSGLVLTNRITEIETKMIYARPDPRGGEVKYRFNCSSGYSYINLKPGGGSPFNGDSAKAVSSTSKLQYLSVPLIIKYNFGQGRLRFMTGAGLQANFLTLRKIQTYITKGSNQNFANTSDINGLKPVYFSGLVSAGASYRLNRFLDASLVPAAQLGFMSINQRSPVKSYINFYGLSFGLSAKL